MRAQARVGRAFVPAATRSSLLRSLPPPPAGAPPAPERALRAVTARGAGDAHRSALRARAARAPPRGHGTRAQALPAFGGPPAADTCPVADFDAEDEPGGSWRGHFGDLARSACAITSAACAASHAAAPSSPCATCTDVECCNWAAAHRAWRHGDAGADLNAVEAHLSAALMREPGNAALLASYAVFLWEERGDGGRATACFDAAAAIDPTDLDVLASRAYFAMTSGM